MVTGRAALYIPWACPDERAPVVCDSSKQFEAPQTTCGVHALIHCTANLQCGGFFGFLKVRDPNVNPSPPPLTKKPTAEKSDAVVHMASRKGGWPAGAMLWLLARLHATGLVLLLPWKAPS